MTTITQERAGHKRVGYDDLILREEWGARFDDYDVPRSVEEPADTQHVHITITNPRNYASDAAHCRGVEAIGIARFPNTGGSYNRGFMQSGRAFELQPIGRRGAHTVNDFRRATCTTSGCPGRGGSLRAPSWNNNITGRAYVICQNVGDEVTDAQVDSMARCMAADRLAGFVRRDAKIHGHRCCSSKSCPGDRMWRRMGELRSKVDHYVRVGLGASQPEPEPEPEPEIQEDPMSVGTIQSYGSSENPRYVWFKGGGKLQLISPGTYNLWAKGGMPLQEPRLSNDVINGMFTLQGQDVAEALAAVVAAIPNAVASFKAQADQYSWYTQTKKLADAVQALADAGGVEVDLSGLDQLDDLLTEVTKLRSQMQATTGLLQEVAVGQVTPDKVADELATRLAD